jgi:hypothetical protein
VRVTGSWIIVLALLVCCPASAGQGPGKSNGKGHGNSAVVESIHTDELVFGTITVAERAIIGGYFAPNRGSSVPELGSVKPLPPGIAKKIARGGSLPPGIAKRYFPQGLMTQLPPRPGAQWLVVGTDVVLINIATNVIIDVLRDVL